VPPSVEIHQVTLVADETAWLTTDSIRMIPAGRVVVVAVGAAAADAALVSRLTFGARIAAAILIDPGCPSGFLSRTFTGESVRQLPGVDDRLTPPALELARGRLRVFCRGGAGAAAEEFRQLGALVIATPDSAWDSPEAFVRITAAIEEFIWMAMYEM
jgi:hypothetical protein